MGVVWIKRKGELHYFDIQFNHAGSQSGAITSKNFRCTTLAAHLPIGYFKDLKNILSFNCFQGLRADAEIFFRLLEFISKTKWRYGYRKNIQAVPEILTEIAVTDLNPDGGNRE